MDEIQMALEALRDHAQKHHCEYCLKKIHKLANQLSLIFFVVEHKQKEEKKNDDHSHL